MTNKIRILGIDYEIVYNSDEVDKENAGEIENCKLRIDIGKDNSPEHAKRVLFHEIFEALDHRLELKLKHSLLTQIEAGLFQILRDNKEITQNIFLEE